MCAPALDPAAESPTTLPALATLGPAAASEVAGAARAARAARATAV